MVQSGTVLAIIFNIIVAFGLPLVLLVILLKRDLRLWRPVFVGAVVFVVFQVIFRIPLMMEVLPKTQWFAHLMQFPISYGIFLGFTAGLAEEIGRYIGYRTALHGQTSWITGIAFGVGHGGIEAMILVGLVNVNDLMFSLSINRGEFHAVVSSVRENIVVRIYTHLTHLEPFDTMLSGLERISVMFIQIAMSLMVLYGAKTKNAAWLMLAIFVHTFVDAPVVILPKIFNFNVYKIELFIAACAVGCLIYILKARKMFIAAETQPKLPRP